MNKTVFLLFLWLCAITAGPVLAGNAKRQPVSKSASFVSKATLEPGHNRPDSAITYRIYGNEQTPETKTVFTYSGNVILETVYRQDWNSGGEWNYVDYEEEYAFDAYGNQTFSIYRSYYDGELSAYKDEYAYNPNGTPLYERFYDWRNGGWILSYDMTYQYDASGMLTGGTFYSLYTDMGEAVIPLMVSGTPENLEISLTINGVIYMKVVLHYDPVAMKLLGREYFELDEETGALESDGVGEYTYDAAGRLQTVLYWDKDYADKTEYTYDAAGRKLSVTELNAESKAGPFTVYGKTEYEYAGNRLERIKWYADYRDGLGSALREITVFYYGGGTGNEQVTLAEVSVYPNPVTDVLTVSGVQPGATLTITSLSGHTVLRQKLADTQATLSVSSLPSGLYFVTVRSGKGTTTFKIIKK
ncbi:MAG: T9SS type A sorting domain-containing protein [Tannerellaceae bacterium]|jgi:hypothetical protein|nr:T9SS type A sorting domain-containing protein [Tannerellaceae bacterium]